MARKPSVQQSVDAYLESIRMDSLADYIARGRTHLTLTGEQLAERWAASYRAMTWDWKNDVKRQIVDDYSQELELRGLKPPWEHVKAELCYFASAVSDEVEIIRRKFPLVHLEMSQDIDDALQSQDSKTHHAS